MGRFVGCEGGIPKTAALLVHKTNHLHEARQFHLPSPDKLTLPVLTRAKRHRSDLSPFMMAFRTKALEALEVEVAQNSTQVSNLSENASEMHCEHKTTGGSLLLALPLGRQRKIVNPD